MGGYFNEGEYSKSLWYQSAPLQTNSYLFNKYKENEYKREGSNAKELLRNTTSLPVIYKDVFAVPAIGGTFNRG